MAFVGVAVFEMVANNICRVTGLSLAAATNGTLSLASGAGAVKLPAAFQAGAYDGPIAGTVVSMQAAVDVEVNRASVSVNNPQLSVVKGGTVPADFLITIANGDAANASGALEIYVKFHT